MALSLSGAEINATKLTSVAMEEASSDVIEVRVVAGHSGLQVLQNQKTLSFTEQSWMDLQGETPLPVQQVQPSDDVTFCLESTFVLSSYYLPTRCVCVFSHSYKRDRDVPQRSRGGSATDPGIHDHHCAPA